MKKLITLSILLITSLFTYGQQNPIRATNGVYIIGDTTYQISADRTDTVRAFWYLNDFYYKFNNTDSVLFFDSAGDPINTNIGGSSGGLAWTDTLEGVTNLATQGDINRTDSVGALSSGSIAAGFTAIAYARLSLTSAILNADLAGSIDLSTKVTSVLPGVNGGTGVANSGKTITLGGNLTTTGAFNTTFAVPATATYTFPASSSTIASLDLGETFTGLKKFNNSTGVDVGLTGGNTGKLNLIGTTSGTVTITVANAAGTWTLTLPNAAGSNGDILYNTGLGVAAWTSLLTEIQNALGTGYDAYFGSLNADVYQTDGGAATGQTLDVDYTYSGVDHVMHFMNGLFIGID